MIYLEEAADQVQLEKCNQTNVKLHHVDDNEFYFFVEVIGKFELTNALCKFMRRVSFFLS